MNRFIISENSTLLDAMQALEGLSDTSLTLFAVNDVNQVVGTITDGDLRRAILKGVKLSECLTDAMQRDFSFLCSGDEDMVLKLKSFRNRSITLVPILDNNNRLVDLCNLKESQAKLPIDAVLMAGGKGERLRPLTETTPKPLLKVGDKAIIDYNVDRLISFGVKNISVTVNYLKEQLEEHYSEPRGSVKVDCVREPKYLGTMGSIVFVDKFYNDTVLVMNSDLFTNIDYEDFYLHFKEHDADMSVASVPYDISIPYGIFKTEGRNIVGISEKPTYNYFANGGIYLIKREMLDLIPNDEFFNATDLIEMLVEQGRKVVRFPITGYWIDIGKHEEYARAKDLVKHIK